VVRVIEAVAKRIGISVEKLEREAVREWLEKRLVIVEAEIAEILNKYGVSSVKGLEEAIEKGRVPEHPAWEDLVILERLVEYEYKLKEAAKCVDEYSMLEEL